MPARFRFPLLRFGFAAMAMAVLAPAIRASDAVPYRGEPAFGELKFDQPLAVVSPPGDKKRVFVVEKAGRILLIDTSATASAATPTPRVFLDLRAQVGDSNSEQGLLALAFHPEWQRNRQFFVYYTHNPAASQPAGARGATASAEVREDRLARFLISETNPDLADPASETLLLAQPDRSPTHNGGGLAFGPDGYLYLALGDEGSPADRFGNSQLIDRDFFSGIVRLDVDRRPGNPAPNPHPAVRASTYAVPADNPFLGATTFNGRAVEPARVRTEFWAVGLRNPWRIAFDSANGKLWAADVGETTMEEINLITRGGNYGWSFREGMVEFRGRPPAGTTLAEPIWTYGREDGGSITGGIVVRGSPYPDLEGTYLFADFLFGRVWNLDPLGDQPVGPDRILHIANAPGIVSFGRDPRDGGILLVSLTEGRILRLVPIPAVIRR